MTTKGVQGPTATRLKLAAKAQHLRKQGFLYREIQEQLGISYSYAQSLIDDPDGSKARARKDGYSIPCPGYGQPCGKPRCGSGGPAELPDLCEDCRKQKEHEERYWTPEAIIGAFQTFEQQTGRTPSAMDTLQGQHPSQRQRFSETRLAQIDAAIDLTLPHPALVTREFGSWSNGLRAAGMTPSRGGAPSHRGSRRLNPAVISTLTLLQDSPLTRADLMTRSNTKESTMQARLTKLVKRGLIERVSHGVYRLAEPIPLKEENMARQFLVLSKQGSVWKELDTVEAINSAHAIEKVALAEGEFVAVPLERWEVQTVKPVTRFAVVEKVAATPAPR